MKQLFSLVFSVAFFAVLLIGCTDGSTLVETDHASATDANFGDFSKSAPGHFVSVGGHDQIGTDDANYSLTAREDADGNVNGQFSDIFKADGAAVGAVHGSVDCLIVYGNTAIVGGIITKEYFGDNIEYPEGSRYAVMVADNGTSSDDDPDVISSTFPEAFAPFFGIEDFTCEQIDSNANLKNFMEQNSSPMIGQVVVR